MRDQPRRISIEVRPPLSPLQAYDPQEVAARIGRYGLEPRQVWGTLRTKAVSGAEGRVGALVGSGVGALVGSGVAGLAGSGAGAGALLGGGVGALVGSPGVALARLNQRRAKRELVVSAAVPEETDSAEIVKRLKDDPAVLSIYSDPRVEISALARCMESDPVGKVKDVAAALKVDELHSRGMDGSGVLLVIVDGGVNLAFLREKGRHHSIDHDLSWSLDGGYSPGEAPATRNSLASHGTVAAFAAGIAAPNCTIVDLAAFAGTTPAHPRMETWLTDIERGLQRIHRHLVTTPNEKRRVVISNSWTLVDPDWDEPEGTELNFSDNADHRFSRYLGELVELGADIVFASGNAGSPCNIYDDLMGDQPISGANSLESVLTTGAVAVDGVRLGYSSSGPGRLSFEKPDLCGFSHYDGSGLWHADGGTSVACPVVAGVIAAIRTRVSAEEMPPRELARVLRETATRSNGDQYDSDMGWGIIDPGAALTQIRV